MGFIASQNHNIMPGIFKERVTTKQLRELLLRGDTIVKGHFVPWQFKKIGVGVYELWADDPFKKGKTKEGE